MCVYKTTPKNVHQRTFTMGFLLLIRLKDEQGPIIETIYDAGCTGDRQRYITSDLYVRNVTNAALLLIIHGIHLVQQSSFLTPFP